MRVQACRGRATFYFQIPRVCTQQKLLRLLLFSFCCFLLTMYLNPRLLTYLGLQSGKKSGHRVMAPRDDATNKKSLESRPDGKLSSAGSLISFSSHSEESKISKLMVKNGEGSEVRTGQSLTNSLDGNRTYFSVALNINEGELDETSTDKREPSSKENLMKKFLSVMSVNEVHEVDSTNVIIKLKPTTWLQVIRIGMMQRDPEYLKKHILVIPDAAAPERRSPNGKSTSLKKILYWNKFYESPDFDFGEGREPFITAGCPASSCYVTSNRTLFPLEEVDAVVWHGRDDDQSLPPKRYPHTRYVFFMAESPEHVYLDFKLYRNVFNYTMTFRPDSDVYNPYGFFTPLPYPALSLLKKNYALGKTKMAAWFVSHCTTASKRERIVENLQQYITVDVFGKCGTKSCPKQKDHNPDECFRLVERKYKFYFAFENSLCDNYITEKFFGAARFDIVPVVYGLGAYEDLAPKHSFINALDFPSIRHLADYLKYLDRNDTAYNEYFEWKVNYKAVMRYKAMVTPEYNQISWCQLCDKLHSDTSISIYEDLNNWRRRYNCINNDLPLFSKLIEGSDVATI